MKTTATKMGFQSAQATTTLPPNYRHHRYFDLAKSRKAVVGAIVSGIVLFFIVGWLFVQFINLVRPPALEALRSNIQTTTSNGATSFTIPFQGVIIALALVMFIHELVHSVFYWWFSGKCPTIGIHGLGIYVGAPSEVYFPRNQYLVVGIAPLVLLTLAGLLLVIIVPVVFVPILIFFVAFNAAGAAGDLLTVALLLSYSPDTLMQDNSSGVILYGPEYS
ncbi:MAG: DUF3267 domain-containing protein [Anaerolineales bacterium]